MGIPRVWNSQTLVARAMLALHWLPGLSESTQYKPTAQAFFALPRAPPKEAGSHQSQLSCSPNRLLEI